MIIFVLLYHYINFLGLQKKSNALRNVFFGWGKNIKHIHNLFFRLIDLRFSTHNNGKFKNRAE